MLGNILHRLFFSIHSSRGINFSLFHVTKRRSATRLCTNISDKLGYPETWQPPPPPSQITLEWNLVRLKATSAAVMWQWCLIGGTNLLSSMTFTWENTRLFTSGCSLRAPASFVFPLLLLAGRSHESPDWKFCSSPQTCFFSDGRRQGHISSAGRPNRCVAAFGNTVCVGTKPQSF